MCDVLGGSCDCRSRMSLGGSCVHWVWEEGACVGRSLWRCGLQAVMCMLWTAV